jgi:hypothetical protein
VEYITNPLLMVAKPLISPTPTGVKILEPTQNGY